MSTSKHIDKICIVAVSLTLVITIVIMCCSSLGLVAQGKTFGYETRLFNTEKVHTIDIVMDDWDTFIENCESEEYSACTVLIDGEKQGNIGIRAKGNTSLSNVSSMGSQRYSFKLEFDQYEKGKSYYGLDKLCLNNIIQDNTMMKDYIAYTLMREYGVDTPLCSFAYITVNGEDWGLYLAVEGIEDSFLQRNYGSDYGELYKPDSLSFGGGRGNGKGFDMDNFDFDSEDFDFSSMTPPDDFDPSSMTMPEGFDPSSMTPPDGTNMPTPPGQSDESSEEGGKTFSMGGFGMGSDDVKLKYIDDDPDSYSNIFDNAKTDVSKSDKTRLISSLKNLTEYTNLEDTVNMDEVLRYFVVHTYLCNGDSYTGAMIHNYYLYEEDGVLSMIPWDYNLAYGTFQGGNASSTINASIDNPVSGDLDDRPMIGWIFSNEEYTEKYHELYSQFVSEWYDSGKITELIESTADMIRPYVEKDPTKFCTTEEFETGVDTMLQYVSLRFEAVSRQLNGDDTAVETGDLNLSDMGSMGNTMGGMDRGDKPSDTQSEDNRPSDMKPEENANTEDNNSEENANAEDKNSEENVISDENITAVSFTSTSLTTKSLSLETEDVDTSQFGGTPPEGFSGFNGQQPPEGFSAPDGQQPPEGFSGFDGQQPPEGFSAPDFSQTQTQETEETTQEASSDDTQEAEPSTEQSAENSDSQQKGDRSSFSKEGFSGFENGEFPGSTSDSSNMSTYILLGVSVLVLAIGLLIAFKKKTLL